MATTTRVLALDEFLALPEQKPALEYGPGGALAQKPMGTTDHSIVQANAIQALNATGLGRAYPELRVVLDGQSRVSDVAFYQRHRLPREQRPTAAPDVVVEVLSPDQAPGDLAVKCRWYVEQGVGVALLADPATRTVRAFHADGEHVARGSERVPVLGAALAADALFQDVLGAET